MLLLAVFTCACTYGQDLHRTISVHDPVMAKQGDTFYLYCTGMGISVWSSTNLQEWKKEKAVFSTPPQWAVEAVPSFKGHIWAPDISYYKGKYYLYYSVSAFGKNTSCIGLATNSTLDPTDTANYKWVDHGKVIQSYPGKTNWNAIDPNLIEDKKGNPYLTFGSFWDGLKLVKLNPDRMGLAESPDNLLTIASRKRGSSSENPPSVGDNPADAGGNAIEAPFIFRKGKYFYLFASTDYCCKGPQSTYKMIVGRAKNVGGPYEDKNGIDMAKAGGTILLEGNTAWYGVGHNAAYTFGGTDYLIFHAYDAADKGRSKLRVERLSWKNGWPSIIGADQPAN